MKKYISIVTILAILLGSCVTVSNPTVDYSYPHDGVTNNVNIAAKDFVSTGIIFVNSVEKIDSLGNHTGSKITYEMLMREANKLGADDVINIKIDVNQKEEKINSPSGMGEQVTVTTYSYTGTGLAIKYTDAIESSTAGKKQDLSSSMIIPAGTTNTPAGGSKSKTGTVFGIVLGLAALVGAGILISNMNTTN